MNWNAEKKNNYVLRVNIVNVVFDLYEFTLKRYNDIAVILNSFQDPLLLYVLCIHEFLSGLDLGMPKTLFLDQTHI